MRKLLMLLLLGGCTMPVFSQIVGIGYNMSFTGLKGMNYVVQRYNETRTYLDKTMDEFKFMDGFTIDFGAVMSKGAFIDLAFSKAVKNHNAEGFDASNTLQQRQLRVAMVDWIMGLGFAMPAGETGSISFGGSLAFGRFKVKTRVGEKSSINKVDWEDIMREPIIRPGIFLRIQTHSPGICIEPYINFNTLLPVSVTPVNRHINPATAGADPAEIKEPLTGFGIRVKFGHIELDN